ncbi:hypothetical protein ACEQPO_14785 [Bacillus sp. SL00103]
MDQQKMTEFYVPSGYINTGASQYDFAVIKTDTNIGNTVGYAPSVKCLT